MLTESEKAWLKSNRMYCNYCWAGFNTDDCEWEWAMNKCPLQADYRDAAKFYERVLIHLSRIPKHYPEGPCDYGNANFCSIDCDWLDCREARIKWAMLKAEEEMDE